MSYINSLCQISDLSLRAECKILRERCGHRDRGPTNEARAETKLDLAMPCKEEEDEVKTDSMRQRETER